MRQAWPTRKLVSGALLFGVVAGVLLFHSSEPHYSFVHGATPLQISEVKSGASVGTVRIYNLRDDWRSVVAEVMGQSPLSVLKEGEFKGLPANTVVIPREEGGRAKLFETPEREITVIRGRFVLGESGAAIAMADDGNWAGIRVIEFRQPDLFDSATQWLHDSLKV